jgi:hypothetical protein
MKSGSKKHSWKLAVAALAIVAVVALWFVDRGGIFPTERVNYRFEVTVDTPHGEMTSYAVHQITIVDQLRTIARNYQINTDGEAVIFPLPDGRYLFATLRFNGGIGIQQLIAESLGKEGYRMPSWAEFPRHFSASISEDSFPVLVTIDSSLRRESLRVVGEAENFRVTSASFVSSGEGVTSEIADLIPWLIAAIHDLTTLNSEITEQHKIISSLKFGVRG